MIQVSQAPTRTTRTKKRKATWITSTFSGMVHALPELRDDTDLTAPVPCSCLVAIYLSCVQ
jgi:hypothetical protein